MKVIMLKDVASVGQKDTLQEVSDGYALNFLIARGLAQQATPAKIAALDARKKTEENSSAQREAQYAALTKRLEGDTLEVKAKANQQGHLYQQLSADQIAKYIGRKFATEVSADSIVLESSIKNTGDFNIEIRLGKTKAHLKLTVSSEN